MRFNRERDCEYTDGDQRSRTEILEEQIAQLQARIRTLESAPEPTTQPAPTSNVIPPIPQGSSNFSIGAHTCVVMRECHYDDLITLLPFIDFPPAGTTSQYPTVGHNQDAL